MRGNNGVINTYFLAFTAIHTVSSLEVTLPPQSNMPEDARLNFTELAIKYGHNCKEYTVTTHDKYLLKLFNIPGDRSKPIYLMHGFLDSADTFIIRGNESLATTLARAGYDVWAGNMRGNKYSRHHLTLNPDTDKKFWDFSLQEIGYYDLPAMINFILDKTSTTQLTAIGHSEGTAVFYVLGSTRPEYNKTIKVMISLAPIAYLQNVKPPLSDVIVAGPMINEKLKVLGQEEFLANSSAAAAFLRIVCPTILVGSPICADGLILTIGGRDEDSFADNFLPIVIAHYPSGTSRKNAEHLDQIALRRSFSQFDYGPAENYLLYKSTSPPEYDLSKVVMKIALFVGENDRISTIADVEILRSQLPNVVDYRIMRRNRMNHYDFVFGAHMYQYLFPDIFEILRKFP